MRILAQELENLGFKLNRRSVFGHDRIFRLPHQLSDHEHVSAERQSSKGEERM